MRGPFAPTTVFGEPVCQAVPPHLLVQGSSVKLREALNAGGRLARLIVFYPFCCACQLPQQAQSMRGPHSER
jgi:hypothetical protein